ncbi:MAG: hypothetical protein WD716_09710 [Fimbriimonadaceae bacterium]
MNARKLTLSSTFALALCAGAYAQIPDLLNALDAGGRAMGLGGATYVTDSNTFSALSNPAGLGYVTRGMYGIAYRNLPESRTVISGNFNDPDFATEFDQGAFGMTHLGYAFPMGRGAVGVTYTRSGFIRDERSGDGLPDGPLTVRFYEEVFRSQTDMFTLSYGTNSGGSTNYGVGLVIANQYVLNRQDYQLFDGNNPVGSVSADNTGTGLGFGIVAGVILSPGNSSNMSVGISAQSPIDLSGNDETSGYYDRIPGRLSAGIAARSDGRNGEYTIYGAQATWFFGGETDAVFSRDSYAMFGGGLEYSMNRWNARIPIRIGYTVVPSGGTGFIDRDAFTFGLGYRPNGSDFSLDLSFARPSDGNSLDMALSITYLLGKQ